MLFCNREVTMRVLFHPTKEQFQLSRIFQALSDPIRLEILKRLDTQISCACHELEIDLPKPRLSHHYKTLRESGLIRVTVQGKYHYLTIRREELDEVFPGLIDSVLRNIEV